MVSGRPSGLAVDPRARHGAAALFFSYASTHRFFAGRGRRGDDVFPFAAFGFYPVHPMSCPLAPVSTRKRRAFLAPLLFALGGAATGWLLHGSFSPAAPASAVSTAASRTSVAPAKPPTAIASAAPAPSGPAVEPLLDRLLFADSTDMVALVESLGELTRLDADNVRRGWASLARRHPVDTMGGSATVVYLWSRMVALGDQVTIPRGWGADQFASTIELVRVRENLPDLLDRLRRGENLGEAERRAVFIDLARENPLDAVRLWAASTQPWDFRTDARWLGAALADPASREATMAELRRWQGQQGGDVGAATLALAWEWIARDPASVESWLRDPAQADVREAVMQQVLNVRVLSDPREAWTWSQALPESERRRALGMSAAQLANLDPKEGARLIAGLSAPAEREAAVREYGKTLAANDLEGWKVWRETLPEGERAWANRAAFDLWVFNEPVAAVDWLGRQPAGAAKDEMVQTLVDVYAGRDPTVAAKWIQSIADPARRRSAAVAALGGAGPENLETVRTILAAAGAL